VLCCVGMQLLATGSGDVPHTSCSEIGSFARQVAEQKTKGIPLEVAMRRLRRSFGSEYPDTERELEKIVQAIYGVEVFSAATPEEVGSAYQLACEMGQ